MAAEHQEQPGDDPPRLVAARLVARPPTTRGRPPAFTRDGVVAAAVDLADRAGLEAVSIGALADALDSRPMTLYRYVPSKAVLLILMADAAVGSGDDTHLVGHWRADLAGWGHSLRAAFHAHPWLLDLPVEGAPVMPHELQRFETGLRAIEPAGLPPARAVSAVQIVAAFVRADAALTRSLTAPTATSMQQYRQLLADTADLGAMPTLGGVLASGALDDDDFLDAADTRLQVVLDGIAAMIATPPPPSAETCPGPREGET